MSINPELAAALATLPPPPPLAEGESTMAYTRRYARIALAPFADYCGERLHPGRFSQAPSLRIRLNLALRFAVQYQR